MEPGDPGSSAAEARDALEALLSQVPCSRLQAEFDPDSGTIALRGHIPEEALREPVLAALQAQVGQGIAVTDSMLILPRPQCGALAGIGAAGLPQSTDQTTNPRIVGNDAHARVFDYQGGDALVLEMQAPDYDAYVYVDYYDAAGNVIHLIPNDVVPLALHPAQSAMIVGQSAGGEPALEITVGPRMARKSQWPLPRPHRFTTACAHRRGGRTLPRLARIPRGRGPRRRSRLQGRMGLFLRLHP